MLTSLSLTNFKSWNRIEEMQLAPITCLFGANSSGKTSILQLLLMLKQTAQSPDRTQVLDLGDERRSLVNLGSFLDLAFGHHPWAEVGWRLKWDLPRELRISNPEHARSTLFSGRELGFSARVRAEEKAGMMSGGFEYEFDRHTFGLTQMSNGKYELSASGPGFAFQKTPGRGWEIPAPVKCYGFPDAVRAYYRNAGFLSDFELALEQFLGNVYYLGVPPENSWPFPGLN